MLETYQLSPSISYILLNYQSLGPMYVYTCTCRLIYQAIYQIEYDS